MAEETPAWAKGFMDSLQTQLDNAVKQSAEASNLLEAAAKRAEAGTAELEAKIEAIAQGRREGKAKIETVELSDEQRLEFVELLSGQRAFVRAGEVMAGAPVTRKEYVAARSKVPRVEAGARQGMLAASHRVVQSPPIKVFAGAQGMSCAADVVSAGGAGEEGAAFLLEAMNVGIAGTREDREAEGPRARAAREFAGTHRVLSDQGRKFGEEMLEKRRTQDIGDVVKKKGAGAKPTARELQLLVRHAFRAAPDQVIHEGALGPSRDSLRGVLSELALIGDRLVVSGAVERAWLVSSFVGRFVVGGDAAVSESLKGAERAATVTPEASRARHAELAEQAFEAGAFEFPGASTVPELLVWRLFAIERHAEERKLADMLYEAVAKVQEAYTKPEEKKAVTRRFILAHWLVRLMTGIYSNERLGGTCYFLCSPDGPLHDLCKPVGHRGTSAVVLDQLLKGMKVSKRA